MKNSDTLLIGQIIIYSYLYDHHSEKYIGEIVGDKRQNIRNKRSTELNEIKNQISQNCYLERKEVTVTNKSRIGRSRITHGFLADKENSPICSTPGTKLFVNHIISNRLKYNQDRIQNIRYLTTSTQLSRPTTSKT